ncbi:unnamed protein product, partial [Ixodes pacificus]
TVYKNSVDSTHRPGSGGGGGSVGQLAPLETRERDIARKSACRQPSFRYPFPTVSRAPVTRCRYGR